MNEIIEKLMHGVLVCIATDTALVHIDRTDAEKIIDLLERQVPMKHNESGPHAYCGRCGTGIKKSVYFCPYCGQAVK